MTTVYYSTLENRSPKTIGLHSNMENDLKPDNYRRGSYPTDALREENNDYEEKTQKVTLSKSHSFHEGMKQPTIYRNGIPLGSLTAQEAAKSFWNMDMLHERLQKITECAAQESSSLGSSLDSFDLQEDIISLESDNSTVVPKSAPSSPLLSPQALVVRSHSAGQRRPTTNLLWTHTSGRPAVKTPPYLSPGAGRRVSTSSKPEFFVLGKGVKLSPRSPSSSSSNFSDDGYYD